MGNEDEFRTDHDGGFVGDVVPLLRRRRRSGGRSTGPTAAAAACSTRRCSAAFDGDIGVFEGEDTFEGRPILVRFILVRRTTPTPRWEQAFSADGGATWEPNWVMEFTPAGGR